MNRSMDVCLTALAPLVWGSTYFVTSEFLPDGYPLTAAMLRALPAGVVLMLLCRTSPRGVWIWRSIILGALNFSIFWWLLFVAAYKLPGGVAATAGAVQPLIVLLLARILLHQTIRPMAVLAGVGGVVGVAILVLTPSAALDAVGIAAAIGGAASMALGTVLTRKWRPPVSTITFASWQLTAGGALLLPASLIFEPNPPILNQEAILALAYLGLLGGAITYILWFRGIARLGPSAAAPLALLSPVAAMVLGYFALGQAMNLAQSFGVGLVILCVWLSQRAAAGAGRS